MPNDWTEDLLSYCLRFEPKIRELLAGASEAEITRLEQISGQRLPLEYRQFLKVMGRRQARILYDYMSTIDINEVLEIYEDIQQGTEPAAPAGYLIIGSGSIILEHDVCLLSYPSSKPANWVSPVYHVIDRKPVMVAESLPHLVFQQAFNRFELQPLIKKINLAALCSRQTPLDVRQAINLCGFSFKSFSDLYNLCAFKDDIRLVAQVQDNGSGWLSLGGYHEDHMEDIARNLMKQIALRRQPPMSSQ